ARSGSLTLRLSQPQPVARLSIPSEHVLDVHLTLFRHDRRRPSRRGAFRAQDLVEIRPITVQLASQRVERVLHLPPLLEQVDPERSFVPVPLEPERRDTPQADLAVDEVTPTECLAVELERLVVESLAVVHRHRRPSALFGNGNPETRGQPGSNSCAIDAFQRRLSGVPLWGWPSGRGRAGKRPRY